MFTWARRRQLYYLLGVLAFFAVIGLILFLIYRPRPTCFDGKQNQTETGIDCGGTCALACAPDVIPLKVYWARPLKVNDGWYDVAALVENENLNFGVRRAPYTLYLYDKDHVLLNKQTGETFINPAEKFIVFASRLNTGSSIADQAFLEFGNNLVWEKARPVPRVINIERKNFTNKPRPQLQITVTNLTLDPISNLRVSTVLSDGNNNAMAASATFVDKLKAQETKEIFLTWPIPLPLDPTFFELYWRLNSFDLLAN
ncbi:MAG: hypothetical protein WC640_02495 [Candidatus Paceibacterota bacterium]|jgi:hypothetical protein